MYCVCSDPVMCVTVTGMSPGITYKLEMQQYIDISPYHDTLGSDTVSLSTVVVNSRDW